MPLVLDQEIYRAILDSLDIGVYVVDLERRIVYWNDGAENITGYLRQEVLGRSCSDNLLQHCDADCNPLCDGMCPLAGTMHDGMPRESDMFLRHKDGHRVPVRIRAVPVRGPDGRIAGVAESFEERVLLPEADVQPNSRAVENRVDRNTGVLDHHSIESHLNAAILDHAQYHIPFSVLSIAVDKLDEFRETHGTRAAETIVGVVAHTLSRNLHHADLVGRWSRNRFVVVLANCPGSEVAKTAEKLRRIVGASAIPWWGDRIAPTVSIGGTAVRADDTVQSLMSRPEEALTQILTEGGNRVNVL